MRVRLTLAVLPLLAVFAAGASDIGDAPSGADEIERIVELMRIRDGLAQGAEQALAMSQLASASEERKACMRRLSVSDLAVEPIRRRLRAAFPDAESRQRTIAFFSSDTGRKVVEWMTTPGARLAEIKATLTPDDYRILVDYTQSGGGEAFRVLNHNVAKDDSVTRAIRQECPRR
jgi:hypothetical protein